MRIAVPSEIMARVHSLHTLRFPHARPGQYHEYWAIQPGLQAVFLHLVQLSKHDSKRRDGMQVVAIQKGPLIACVRQAAQWSFFIYESDVAQAACNGPLKAALPCQDTEMDMLCEASGSLDAC